jgi:hypothetical protein
MPRKDAMVGTMMTVTSEPSGKSKGLSNFNTPFSHLALRRSIFIASLFFVRVSQSDFGGSGDEDLPQVFSDSLQVPPQTQV